MRSGVAHVLLAIKVRDVKEKQTSKGGDTGAELVWMGGVVDKATAYPEGKREAPSNKHSIFILPSRTAWSLLLLVGSTCWLLAVCIVHLLNYYPYFGRVEPGDAIAMRRKGSIWIKWTNGKRARRRRKAWWCGRQEKPLLLEHNGRYVCDIASRDQPTDVQQMTPSLLSSSSFQPRSRVK